MKTEDENNGVIIADEKRREKRGSTVENGIRKRITTDEE
jgi:hypothetical protein